MFNLKSYSTCFAILLLGIFSAVVRAEETAKAEYLSESLSSSLLSATQDWGQLGFNTAAFAVPGSALKLRIKDKEYAHGLGHHANGEIVVELDGEFKEFQAEVGVQWQGANTAGSVIFQIYADDKKVFDSGVMRQTDAPRPVAISVEGVDELRLVATDAGDGIVCDVADWADARLVRNPAAAKKSHDRAVDIAPFGMIATWDPQAMTGTKATRLQEMPAEDIYTAKGLLPTDKGTYQVPIVKETGCIGLQWDENRILRSVALELAGGMNVPAAESIQLQYWTGESAWQGNWVPADIKPEMSENRWVWNFQLQQFPRGTQKVRWIFADAKKPIELKEIQAYSRSRWQTVDVRLEATNTASPKKAEIELYNGIFVGQQGKAAHHCTWDTSKPLSLKVLSSPAQRYKADRTVLRLTYPETAFGIAVEDLQANDCVYVPHAGVFATREPAPVKMADYLKKITGKQTVLEEVRQKPDQDFTKAWAAVHRPVEDLEETMLSLACDNRKFIVRRDGPLGFNVYDSPFDTPTPETGFNWIEARQWRLLPRFGSGQNAKLSRHLAGDWLPIIVTKVVEDDMTYEQTAYVAPASEAVAGEPSWIRQRAVCAVEYTIGNTGKLPADARLLLNFSPSKDNKQSVQFRKVNEGLLAVAGDRVLAMIDTRKAMLLTAEQTPEGILISGKLPDGVEARCTVLVPAWKVAPADYAELIGDGQRFAKLASYWNAYLDQGMKLEIPDTLLSNIIKASQVHCAIAARNDKQGALVAPWIASEFYGPLESEANAIIRGMSMNGQEDFARRGLEFFLAKCNAAGFITTGYTTVGTGEVLWTLGEHYERTRDREWLKKVAPDVVRICKWVMRQREKTKQLDAQGQKRPSYGLMPPGVSADWNRFAFRFFNDAQYYEGLAFAGQALADIGDTAAAEILADAKEYRDDIKRAYRWTQARMPVVPLANGTWVPADPSLLDCFGRVEDFIPGEDAGRTWCYSVEAGAHHLVADGVLDPSSHDASWIMDYLEDVQFLRDGWGDYPAAQTRQDIFNLGGFAKLQPYYCRNAEISAMRDDVKPYIRSYFNAIPSLVNSENLSFCEHFNNLGAWNKTHETGWFLCQTELMFVMERGDELWLAPFVTNRWLQDGLKVSVQNAPTGFGKVGYTINSAVAKGEIEAVVELPSKCTAKKIVLRLRHPDGKPMQSVTVNGKPHADFDAKKETITIAPGDEKITVRAKY